MDVVPRKPRLHRVLPAAGTRLEQALQAYDRF
jgi:hypothetical protein